MAKKKTDRKPALQIQSTPDELEEFASAADREGHDTATAWARFHLRRLARGIESTTIPEAAADEIQQLRGEIARLDSLNSIQNDRINELLIHTNLRTSDGFFPDSKQ